MIRIVCVGKTKDMDIAGLVIEYSKRMGKYTSFEIVHVKDERSGDVLAIKEKEGKVLLEKAKGFIIALDANGKEFTSEYLADFLKTVQLANPNITFLIGGPYGLSEEVKRKANLVLALSKMTFTHETALFLLTEQIYRAFTIMKNENYHK